MPSVLPTTRRKFRLGSTFGFEDAWQAASDQLGVDMNWTDFAAGPVVKGKVNDHLVHVALLGGTNRKRGVRTAYDVNFAAPQAPAFSLTKRFSGNAPIVDSGDHTFDTKVAVTTDNPAAYRRFMTATRKAAIIRLLDRWPLAKITNDAASFTTEDIEQDVETFVDSVCYLVALAETFDRAEAAVDTELLADDDVALDEATVLADLFGSNLDPRLIGARFEQVYRGSEISWSGEILTVGSRNGAIKQVAVLIGSADGQNPQSGRVVALTSVPVEASIAKGDVMTFSGTLKNLEPRRRVFNVA